MTTIIQSSMACPLVLTGTTGAPTAPTLSTAGSSCPGNPPIGSTVNLGTPAEALSALRQARQLGIWFVRAYARDRCFDPGPFRPPEPPANATAELTREIDRLRRAIHFC